MDNVVNLDHDYQIVYHLKSDSTSREAKIKQRREEIAALERNIARMVARINVLTNEIARIEFTEAD